MTDSLIDSPRPRQISVRRDHDRLRWECPTCGRRVSEAIELHVAGELVGASDEGELVDATPSDEARGIGELVGEGELVDDLVAEIRDDPHCYWCRRIGPGDRVRDRHGYEGVVLERVSGTSVKIRWDEGRVVRRRPSVENDWDIERASSRRTTVQPRLEIPAMPRPEPPVPTDPESDRQPARARNGAAEPLVVLEDFLDSLALRGRSENTRGAYRADVIQWIHFIQEKECSIVDVDRALLREFLASLRKRGLKHVTIARKVHALRSFYQYLQREGFVERNPAATVSTPRLERRVPPRMEVGGGIAVIEACETTSVIGRRDRAILELLFAAGLRISELAGLDRDGVDLSGRLLHVHGKGRKDRIVPFGEPAGRRTGLARRSHSDRLRHRGVVRPSVQRPTEADEHQVDYAIDPADRRPSPRTGRAGRPRVLTAFIPPNVRHGRARERFHGRGGRPTTCPGALGSLVDHHDAAVPRSIARARPQRPPANSPEVLTVAHSPASSPGSSAGTVSNSPPRSRGGLWLEVSSLSGGSHLSVKSAETAPSAPA